MKTGIRVIVLTMMAAILLLIVMAVMGRTNRSMEIRSNLSSAVEETVENLAVKKYDIANPQEYAADFTGALSDSLDTDADIIVTVNSADKEKGILNLTVKEEFLHPNGRPGSVSCERAVILNCIPEEVPQTFSVRFYVATEDVGIAGRCYRKYVVLAGETVPAPTEPVWSGKTFAGWCDADGNPVDLTAPAEGDMIYYAVWH